MDYQCNFRKVLFKNMCAWGINACEHVLTCATMFLFQRVHMHVFASCTCVCVQIFTNFFLVTHYSAVQPIMVRIGTAGTLDNLEVVKLWKRSDFIWFLVQFWSIGSTDSVTSFSFKFSKNPSHLQNDNVIGLIIDLDILYSYSYTPPKSSKVND